MPDAAIEVISREGVDGAPLRTICDRVGVRLPTLYHFFGDRQGLLDSVLEACLERYLESKRRLWPTGDPRKDLSRGWDLHVGFARWPQRNHRTHSAAQAGGSWNHYPSGHEQ